MACAVGLDVSGEGRPDLAFPAIEADNEPPPIVPRLSDQVEGGETSEPGERCSFLIRKDVVVEANQLMSGNNEEGVALL
jgi:hypothetical protein